MRIGMRRFLVTATVLGLALGAAGRGQAAILLTATEVGSDVLLTGSGTANLADLFLLPGGGGATGSSGIDPSEPAAVTGPANPTLIDVYVGVNSPAPFGPGGLTFPTSGTGDVFGANSSVLVVPTGYTSGVPLFGTSTFAGATLASLGVTPGTYVWTWGTGANADSLTLQIVPTAPAAIPEPGTLSLLLMGGMTTGAGVLRRRRNV